MAILAHCIWRVMQSSVKCSHQFGSKRSGDKTPHVEISKKGVIICHQIVHATFETQSFGRHLERRTRSNASISSDINFSCSEHGVFVPQSGMKSHVHLERDLFSRMNCSTCLASNVESTSLEIFQSPLDKSKCTFPRRPSRELLYAFAIKANLAGERIEARANDRNCLGLMGNIHLICCNFVLFRCFVQQLVVFLLHILTQFWQVLHEFGLANELEFISSTDTFHVGPPDTALHQHAVA